jgi:hypothetical protein
MSWAVGGRRGGRAAGVADSSLFATDAGRADIFLAARPYRRCNSSVDSPISALSVEITAAQRSHDDPETRLEALAESHRAMLDTLTEIVSLLANEIDGLRRQLDRLTNI